MREPGSTAERIVIFKDGLNSMSRFPWQKPIQVSCMI
jgi:hypothetical protein